MWVVKFSVRPKPYEAKMLAILPADVLGDVACCAVVRHLCLRANALIFQFLAHCHDFFQAISD